MIPEGYDYDPQTRELRPSLSPEQVLINPPKVPGTVEDSHAKLAADIRKWPRAPQYAMDAFAARVEQLGREVDSTNRLAVQTCEQLSREKAAREAEIATVREEIAKAWPDRITIGDLKEWAARLGGALVESEKESASKKGEGT